MTSDEGPRPLVVAEPVQERPLSEWSTIAVELLGVQTHYVAGPRWRHRVLEAGQGPLLLLYHGPGGHADTYARVLRALARDFRVLAVDALFHGFSSKEPFARADMWDLMADGVVDLLDGLGSERAHFLGDGNLGVNLGFRHPERVDHLVLDSFAAFRTERSFAAVPPAGRLGALSAAALRDPTPETVRARLEWAVARPERITDELVALRHRLYLDPAVNASMQRVFAPGVPFDVVHDEADFAAFAPGPRTLLVWGASNMGRGYDYGRHCAGLIGATFYGVDDAGHWPQWERPDEFVQAVRQFLTV